jgi:hypothetical protein
MAGGGLLRSVCCRLGIVSGCCCCCCWFAAHRRAIHHITQPHQRFVTLSAIAGDKDIQTRLLKGTELDGKTYKVRGGVVLHLLPCSLVCPCCSSTQVPRQPNTQLAPPTPTPTLQHTKKTSKTINPPGPP